MGSLKQEEKKKAEQGSRQLCTWSAVLKLGRCSFYPKHRRLDLN